MESGARPSFEETPERLEEIVRLLEEGETGLGEALARYEEAVELLRHVRAGRPAVQRLPGQSPGSRRRASESSSPRCSGTSEDVHSGSLEACCRPFSGMPLQP
ncbi:MAG: exodeoxyribonuclease VII small subunit [Planctomycetes bacterium RBG_13_63_9]|nr:MAG: exodeoxyribonuclease VII small subunit [Planctomycetes bacterium RBG_13_63_9]